MRIKMKRIIGILVTIGLVLGMMPRMSLTAYAAGYELKVDGWPIGIGEHDIGGGKLSLAYAEDRDLYTLTLANVNIVAQNNDNEPGIFFTHTGSSTKLKIELVGENTIIQQGLGSSLEVTGADVTLSGSGSLTATSSINAADLTIDGCTVHSDKYIRGSLALNIVGDAEVSAPQLRGADGGVFTIAGGTVTVTNSSNGVKGIDSPIINITGGTVTVSCTGSNSTGICAGAEGISGNINISGGTVTASGTSTGIYAATRKNYKGDVFGGINISGGEVTVSGTGSNSTGVKIGSAGNVSITGGTVTASGEGKAIEGTVKNSFDGKGWEDAAGTSGETAIDKNKDPGQSLSYKKVYFEATNYPLWVGGKQVTDGNEDDIDGNSKASYNVETNTLTLNGYQYSGSSEGIKYVGYDDLNIVIEGENSITSNENKNGIISYGTAIISGTGSLSVKGSSFAAIYAMNVTINSGTVTAEGEGSFCFGIRSAANNSCVTINGGTVTASGYCGIMADNGGTVTIKDGSVTAKSSTSNGIQSSGDVIISGGELIASGKDAAISNDCSIKNYIAGTGWTDSEGTQGKAVIAINTEGQSLADYKKVQFPALDPAEVTLAPTANTLTSNGQAQALVTAGEATGGEMQYALGTDATTAPTSGWGTSIPTGTDAGTYYVWYMVKGDDSHLDVAPECVEVEIKEESKDDPEDDPKDDPEDDPKDDPEIKYSNEWVDGQWYDANGKTDYAPKGSWKQNEKGWWYEDTSGWYPVNCWQKIDGVWYHFKFDGYMAANEWIEGFWLDSDGAWRYEPKGSWKQDANGWWYSDTSGWYPKSQWQKIDNIWYYFGDSGYILTNQYVDIYWLNANGEWGV